MTSGLQDIFTLNKVSHWSYLPQPQVAPALHVWAHIPPWGWAHHINTAREKQWILLNRNHPVTYKYICYNAQFMILWFDYQASVVNVFFFTQSSTKCNFGNLLKRGPSRYWCPSLSRLFLPACVYLASDRLCSLIRSIHSSSCGARYEARYSRRSLLK